jgi:hypothetical protein
MSKVPPVFIVNCEFNVKPSIITEYPPGTDTLWLTIIADEFTLVGMTPPTHVDVAFQGPSWLEVIVCASKLPVTNMSPTLRTSLVIFIGRRTEVLYLGVLFFGQLL